MSLEVKSAPRRADMTYLPAEIVDHFASQGAQVGLRKRSPDVLSMDYTIGWRPVETDSLPADVLAVVKACFEVRDGSAQRGDCLLASRTFEAQEYHQQLAEELRLAQEDDRQWVEAIEDGMQQLARSTGKATGRSLLVGNVPYLKDQVLSGDKLAPIVEEELRREKRGGRPHRTA